MRTQFFQLTLIIILGCSLFSCNQQQSLQSMIDRSIKNKDSVLVIPDGKYVIDQPLRLSGVNNLVIKAESPNGVTITSSMDLPIEDLTSLDKTIGLYEYTDPKLIMPPWPDSFKGLCRLAGNLYCRQPIVHIALSQ